MEIVTLPPAMRIRPAWTDFLDPVVNSNAQSEPSAAVSTVAPPARGGERGAAPACCNLMRTTVARFLVVAVIAALLLPIVLGVVLGLGSLLMALGDAAAAAVCRRLALLVGVLWLVSVIATAIASGIVAVEAAARTESRGPIHGTDRRVEEKPS